MKLSTKKKAKRAAYKTLHLIAGIAMVVNISMVGVFAAPKAAYACHGNITVIKHVVNGNGGTAQASNWTMYITNDETNINFPGNEKGTTKRLSKGSYQVTESETPKHYALTYSGDCDANGIISIENNGDEKTCILTNTYIPYCGDGVVNQDSEQCDGTDGNIGEHQICTDDCQLQSLTYCGDGIKQSPNDEGIGGPNNDGYEECDGTDGVGENQTCTGQCTLENIPYCNLTITKKVSDNNENLVEENTASVGETLTYTINYKNTGTGDCTGGGVKIYDNLDSRLSYVNGTLEATEHNGNGDGITLAGHFNGTQPLVNAHIVKPGESGTVTFKADINRPEGCGNFNILNQANIWSKQTGTIPSNQVNTEVNMVCTGTITGTKFNDLNGNGTRDDNEPAIAGVEISLNDGLKTATTDENGTYSFENIPTGTDYQVSETVPDGWMNTTGNPVTGVEVNAGEITTVDFGNYQPGKIHGYKYDDQGNKLNGWEICLIPELNQLNKIVTTNQNCVTTGSNGWEDGYYEFTDLNAGTYDLSESNQLNWRAVNPISGRYNGIEIFSGDDLSYNFVNRRDTGTITVNKFVQYPNGSSDYNPENWSWSLDNETEIAGGEQRTVLTNKEYTVTEDTSSYPGDNYSTTWVCYDNDNNPNLTSANKSIDPIAQGNGTSFKITLTYNEQNIVCTFTNSRNTTEITFDKVVIGGEESDSAWEFAIDGQGDYHEGDIAVLPTNADYVVTESSQYDDLYTLTGASGICELVDGQIILHSGNEGGACIVENTRNTGTITGTKFNDLNGNGTRDDNEPAIAGVEISLNDGLKTATTDENGTYSFENIPTGTDYQVSETVPDGWMNTTGNPVTGVEVNAGEITTVDFGNQQKLPELTLTKTISDSELVPGGFIDYTLTYKNTGNIDLTGVKIVDDYPQDYVAVSDMETAVSDDGDKITWDIGNLAIGQSGTVNYTVSIKNGTPADTNIVNTATIFSDQTDPMQAAATTLIPPEKKTGAPILTIDKTVDKDWANPGDEVTYTVTVKNTGDTAAINVQLTDLLPAGFTFVDFGSATHTYSLGDIQPGNETTVTYKVKIDKSTNAGTYENYAVASADNYGNVSDKAPVEIRIPQTKGEEALPKLVITKTADKDWINPGDEVTYTVKVENKGEAPAVNVQLQDVMPAGFTFEDGAVTNIWKLGDIAEGKYVQISYKAKSDKTALAGTYKNLAIAWADNTDKVSDSVKIEVRTPVVLGEELPTTGGGIMFWLYLITAGLILAFAGYMLKLTFSRKKF